MLYSDHQAARDPLLVVTVSIKALEQDRWVISYFFVNLQQNSLNTSAIYFLPSLHDQVRRLPRPCCQKLLLSSSVQTIRVPRRPQRAQMLRADGREVCKCKCCFLLDVVIWSETNWTCCNLKKDKHASWMWNQVEIRFDIGSVWCSGRKWCSPFEGRLKCSQWHQFTN